MVLMKYCGSVGKPDGQQIKHTLSYSQGSLQPARKYTRRFTAITANWRTTLQIQSDLKGILVKAIVCIKYGSPDVLQLKEAA